MKRPEVEILLVTWNAQRYLKRCIESIRRHTSAWPYRLIVVDNGSSDGTWGWLRRQRDLLAIRNRRNFGVARASNQALRASKSQWLVRISDDVEVPPGWLDRLWLSVEGSDRVGMVGCLSVTPEGWIDATDGVPGPAGWTWHGLHERDLGQRSYRKFAELVSGCTLRSRRLHEEVGLYDERFSDAAEDRDFRIRTRLAGFRVVFEGSVRVLHHRLNRRRPGSEARNFRFFRKKWGDFRRFPLPDSDPLDRAHLLTLRSLLRRRFREALRHLAPVVDRPPTVTSRLLEGLCRLHLGQGSKVQTILEPMARFSPHASYLVGVLEARRGNRIGAEESFRNAMALCPLFSPSFPALCTFLLGQGRLVEATAVAAEGIRRFPQHLGLQGVLATLSYRRGECRRAGQIFARGLHVPWLQREEVVASSLCLYPIF